MVADKIAEKITKINSKSTRDNLRNIHMQWICLRKFKYHQKFSRNLLIKIDYYSYKYVDEIEWQKITNLPEKIQDKKVNLGER